MTATTVTESVRIPAPSKAAKWTGWGLSVLACLPFLPSAFFKLSQASAAVEGFQKYHYPASVVVPLGIVEVLCLVLYLIPQTAVLGAILLTGYLGGAIATHVQASEPFIIPVLIGVVLWVALYLREPRLRALAPILRRA
jgi:hypothetical protein